MPRTHMNLIVVIAATLVATSAIAESNHEEHAHDFSKDVDALHAALAPLWHEHAGEERSRKVCAQTNTLENLTRDIQNGDTRLLLKSIAALKVRCQTSPTNIEDAFTQVHDAFHHLTEN